MEQVLKYFPELSDLQQRQLEKLMPVYSMWNQKINIVSRKDIDELYIRHVLHSLAITKIVNFVPHTKIIDIGTGGGFPGIPLAIFFPSVKFLLVDSIEKKIKVVNEVIKELGLTNVTTFRGRAENVNGKFDFVICRAVAKLDKLLYWTKTLIHLKQINALPNGMLALKGGDLTAELEAVKDYHEVYNLGTLFKEPFFETKKLVYVQMG